MSKETLGAPLAYENTDFLDSSDGRAIRILSEYQEPLARLRRQRIQDTIVFFGSARTLPLDLAQANVGRASADAKPMAEAAERMARYYEDARKLAHLLTRWSLTLGGRRNRFVITSGGGPGIMEAANRGAYEASGKTIGFNISLPFEQFANPYITPGLNFQFHYFFMRKFWFAYLAKALVVFPGGFGTLDEMFECITLAQTHKLAKQLVVVVYGSDYWKPLINFQQLITDGMISAEDMDLFRFVDTPEEAFEYLRSSLTARFLTAPPQADETSGEVAREVPRGEDGDQVPEIMGTNN